MNRRWYHVFPDLSRYLLRSLVVGWSLERKSLLFFAVALMLPIGLAIWFIVQVVAERLVMQTTRQAARDYAKSIIAWRHVDRRTAGGREPIVQGNNTYFAPDALAILREDLVDNPDYRYEFLMLDDVVQHNDLYYADLPSSAREERLLLQLESEFRERLAAAEPPADGGQNAEQAQMNEPERATRAESQPAVDLLGKQWFLYQEDGPVYPEQGSRMRFAEETPADGWYVYYHAVDFTDNCLGCHQRYLVSDADDVPFRVVKVLLPFEQTQVASATTLALIIAVAMVTIAATLLVVHWVLRRLVLNPLRHLKQVSDEISRGNTDLRAHIDTGDEFHELAAAFNRMLRHMTEGQQKLQQLNRELDIRIDQLAQANLHLFEANRLKSDFLANMSHELRTPLNSIIGFSDVLHDISALNDKQRRYVSNIKNSGRLLLDMINDILDLAKVEAGKMQVTPTSFDLGELIEAQSNMLHGLVDEKNMDLQIQAEEDFPEIFQDRSKIQQILTNLLSNAIKFTPDGGLVTISFGLASDSYFYIRVEDTGVGIPESDFEIIFEKFRQSNSVLENDGLTRQHPGTGLGLSIVKELCKLLGGEVRLSSQLGRGSTFQVVLPVQYQHSPASQLVVPY